VTRQEATSLPAQRRRQARQWERDEQIVLAKQLAELLDPECVWWSSIDNQPWSQVAGIWRKRRGVRSGTPDVLILHKRLIGLELKSLTGKLSRAQKEIRLEILRAGGRWFLVRTARAGLVALHRSRVPFRRPWTPPVLEAWEKPVTDPTQPMVWHPAVLHQWREDKKQQRERQRAREISKPLGDQEMATGRQRCLVLFSGRPNATGGKGFNAQAARNSVQPRRRAPDDAEPHRDT
jgi:hypothetical protein